MAKAATKPAEKKKGPRPHVITPEGRVSFAYVYEKSEMSGKYEVTLIFDENTDLAALEQLVEETANERWGKGKWPKNFRHPLRDNSEKEELQGYEQPGRFCRAWRDTRPNVVGLDVDPSTGSLRQLTQETEEFYSGCYAKASVNAFAYDKNGNLGVAFGLLNVQKTKDGEPFSGGRSNPDEDFGLPADVEEALK